MGEGCCVSQLIFLSHEGYIIIFVKTLQIDLDAANEREDTKHDIHV